MLIQNRALFFERKGAYTTFPKDHWTNIYSNNPIERLNGEIKRRTNAVGIFPNELTIVLMVGAILLE